MMIYTFANAKAFNQDIRSWNTSSVTTIADMFLGSSIFNQDISGWDTSNVTDLWAMFYNASAFNQDIGGWDTTKNTRTGEMFWGATAFDQDISNWNVANVTNMESMFYGAGLSTANYDALLIGWNAQALHSDLAFHGGNSTYCLGETARANMISSDGWTITDGGKDCPGPSTPANLDITTPQQWVELPRLVDHQVSHAAGRGGHLDDHQHLADLRCAAPHVHSVTAVHPPDQRDSPQGLSPPLRFGEAAR